MISSETSTFYSEILRRLEAARKKEHNLALLYGAMTAFLISILLVLIIVVLDQYFCSIRLVARSFLLPVSSALWHRLHFSAVDQYFECSEF